MSLDNTKLLDFLGEVDKELSRKIVVVAIGGTAMTLVKAKPSTIDVDFTIVACASFYKMDLVVSDDQKTLLSKPAIKAYKHICIKEGLWNPNFWKYSDLRIRYGF